MAEFENIRSRFLSHAAGIDDLAHAVLRELVRHLAETSSDLRLQRALLTVFEQKKASCIEQIRDLERDSDGDGTDNGGDSDRAVSRRRLQLTRCFTRALDQVGACMHRVTALELRRSSLQHERRELGSKLRAVRAQTKELELSSLDLLSRSCLLDKLPLPEPLSDRRSQLLRETLEAEAISEEEPESEGADDD